MVDLSVRIANNSQNFILMLEVVTGFSWLYRDMKIVNPNS